MRNHVILTGQHVSSIWSVLWPSYQGQEFFQSNLQISSTFGTLRIAAIFIYCTACKICSSLWCSHDATAAFLFLPVAACNLAATCCDAENCRWFRSVPFSKCWKLHLNLNGFNKYVSIIMVPWFAEVTNQKQTGVFLKKLTAKPRDLSTQELSRALRNSVCTSTSRG